MEISQMVPWPVYFDQFRQEVKKQWNLKFSPCYLVLQPTQWCKNYEHIIEIIPAWCQCDYHCRQGRGWMLCNPDDRDKSILILGHDHIDDPACIEPRSENCPACQTMFADPQYMSKRDEYSKLRIKLANDSEHIPPEELAKLQEACKEAYDTVMALENYYQKKNVDRVVEEANTLLLQNPPMRIHGGRVDPSEADRRPQRPQMNTLKDLLFIENGLRLMDGK